MIKIYTEKYFLTFILFASISFDSFLNSALNTTASNSKQKTQTIYDKFAQDYLANFEITQRKEEAKEAIGQLPAQPSIFQLGKADLKINLSAGEIRKIVLESFSQKEATQNKAYPAILSSSFTRDIELFNGYLFKELNKTLTVPGEIELAKMLITPTNNIDALKNRQELVKKLLNDENLFKQIDTSLRYFKKNENTLFSFYSNLGTANAQAVTMLYSQLAQKLNKSPSYLTFATYALPTLFGTVMGASALVAISGIATKKPEIAIPFAIFTAAYMLMIPAMKNQFDTIKQMQGKLIEARTCIDAIRKIYNDTKNIPQVNKCIPEINKINLILNNSEKISSDLNLLISNLKETTFKGQASFLSSAGRVLVAYKLMHEIKEEFTEAYQIMGKIDAFLSITKLYKAFKDKNVKFSFVEYVESNEPSIEIKNFHHPIIDPKVVVTNSVNFGPQSGVRVAIITGPNAGGKSTVLKSVATCLLLSQTIGIVPAQEMSATIFDKLCTYMNITDNIKAGQSLFMAEALRAIELQKIIESGQKVFVASDEIFTGTDPIEGSAAAFAFAEEAANHPNCILMLATHFPLLTELEKETNVAKNFTVKVNKIEEGKIVYPFKLETGVSGQRVAIDILRIKGLSSKMLDRAKEIIERISEKK